MISVRVRYYGPTNTRGAKLVATDGQHHLRVAYHYGDDATEKLNAAKEFCRVFLKHAPELNPTPSEFNGDSFYTFKEKTNLQALNKHIEAVLDHYGFSNPDENHMLTKVELISILNRALLTAP